MTPRKHAKHVVAVALEGFSPLDLALATSVFAAGRPNAERLYAFTICGLEVGSVRGGDGFAVRAEQSLSALDGADIVIVPGVVGGDWAGRRPLIDALCRVRQRGATIVGVREAAALVHRAGVVHGDRAGVVACATSMAALEYFLRVVRLDWGDEIAGELARDIVGGRRTGGEAQVIEPVSAAPADVPFARTLEWMRVNTHRPIRIGAVAARACMSKRHFMRRFSEETGMTPVQWLLDRRVLAAQELLVSSDLPLKQVAARVGFPSARALRDQFKQRTGSSAISYRDAHRRKL